MSKDRYTRIYEQFEEEAERYFRDYTLYDVDRYGMGGGIMKLILSMMAMHAMSSMIGNQSQAGQQGQKPSAAAPTTPSNQDFEKLHPRAQTPGGNQKPGQFAPKPDAGGSPPAPAPPQREARPLTERPDIQSRNTMAQQNQPAAPQPQIQTPTDPNTARIAEIWHGKDAVQADDFGAGVDVTPQKNIASSREVASLRGEIRNHEISLQQNKSLSPDERQSLESMLNEKRDRVRSMAGLSQPKEYTSGNTSTTQNTSYDSLEDIRRRSKKTALKTEPAAPNPRKKTLPDGSANPAYAPQQINPKELQPRQKPEKAPAPEKPSLLDRQESDAGSNADIFANPAAKARKEKAELDRITKFDPSEFGDGIEQPDAPMAKPTIESVQGDFTALETAREQRAKQVKENSDWDKKANRDPIANIADVATEHELDHEPFSKYAQEMQAFEESEWKRREGVKTAIRKAWKVDGSDLSKMENRGQDHSNLQRGDELKGTVADSDLYEFLGPDEGEWSQNAWTMLREEQPERPGAHSKDWLQSHAENFKRLQSMIEPDTELYPEPEDGMPFSRKSLTKEIDRYFRQHLSRIRATKANSDSQSWTALDSWL